MPDLTRQRCELQEQNRLVEQNRAPEQPQTREQATVCWGCPSAFPSLCAVLIHLESGACEALIRLADVNYTFATHPRAEHLLVPDFRKTLTAFLSREAVTSYLPYACSEQSCNAQFKHFSGLLQHSESERCGFQFGDSPSGIIKHMALQVYRDSVVHKLKALKSIRHYSLYFRSSQGMFKEDQGNEGEWRKVIDSLIRSLDDVQSQIKLSAPFLHQKRTLEFESISETAASMEDFNQAFLEAQDKYFQLDSASQKDKVPCEVLLFFQNTGKYQPLNDFLDAIYDAGVVISREFKEVSI